MNNATAIGYALIAAKDIGLTKEQQRRLESAMRRAMDEVTEAEAEEVYRKA